MSAGTLTLNRSGGALADTTAVTVASGATLTVSQNDTIGSLAGAGNVVLGAKLTTGDGANTTISGAISGAGGLVKQGSGTLTLSGANTHTGETQITGGVLILSGGSAIADTATVVVSNGTLTLDSDETIGSMSGSGPVNLGSHTLTIAATADGSSGSSISGTGGVKKTGAGTFQLYGTNTYTGATEVSGGVLQLVNQTSVGTGMVTLDGGTLYFHENSTLANAFTIGAGGGTISGEPVSIAIGGNIAGAGALTKLGTGVLTLSGTNTYSGGTTVSAGTLTGTTSSVQGAIANNAAVVVQPERRRHLFRCAKRHRHADQSRRRQRLL